LATLTEKKAAAQLAVPVWVALLKKNNVPDNMITLTIAQMILESAYFTSDPYKLNKNPGGITWNKNYLKRPGTSKGSLRPADEGGNYVKFDSYDTAAKDYVRIINRAPGKPIEATNETDFAHRLALNGYFDVKKTSEQSYLNNLKSIGKRLEDWTNITALIKKKNSLTMAGISPVVIGLILGFLFYRKK
jgi:uncharacterized FlgJ-related protein